MNVVILDVCKKEMSKFPKKVLEDFFDTVALLRKGVFLTMPLSKAMTVIGHNVHELRFKEQGGAYRVFYMIKKKDAIYILHAFQKKTQKTPRKNIDIVKKRMRRL